MHEWQSSKYLADHFAEHGWKIGARTIEEYDASARSTIERGTIFSYEDDTTSERRVGCYDRVSGFLTILSDDDRWIVSHFPCAEIYVKLLFNSTYGREDEA